MADIPANCTEAFAGSLAVPVSVRVELRPVGSATTPVYELLGKDGLKTGQMPQAGQVVGSTLGYFMHAGAHGSLPSDWPVFLDFLERPLAPGN